MLAVAGHTQRHRRERTSSSPPEPIRGAAIHDENLLPHLAGETRAKPFQLVDRCEGHWVIELLYVERGDLGQEGQ
jgi:hypothetical protein